MRIRDLTHTHSAAEPKMMVVLGGGLKLPLPSPLACNPHRAPPQKLTPLLPKCALTKQAHRFLSTLTTTTTATASATDKLIRKFVASSPKSVALQTLSHLLSPRTSHPHLSSLALPVSTTTQFSFIFCSLFLSYQNNCSYSNSNLSNVVYFCRSCTRGSMKLLGSVGTQSW